MDPDPSQVLTRAEFRKRRDALERALRIGVPIVAGVALSALWGSAWGAPHWWTSAWGNGIGLVLLLAFAGWLDWVTKRTSSRFGACCPSCRVALRNILGRIALASGRCGRCGAVVCE